MSFISCLIQHIPLSWECIAIPFLIAFAVYNLNRATDKDEDAINRQERFSFTVRYEKGLTFLSIAGTGTAVVISALHNLASVIVTLTPFICGILYSIRWLPPGLPYRRLKEIPFVKNLMVGFAWSFFLGLLPVTLAGQAPGLRTLIVCLLFFFWGIMASTIPDIRDRAGDARVGVKTIPVLYGEEKTKGLLTSLNLLFSVPVILLAFWCLAPAESRLVAATGIYSLGCIQLVGVLPSTDFICDILADGQYIFFAVGILLLGSIPAFG